MVTSKILCVGHLKNIVGEPCWSPQKHCGWTCWSLQKYCGWTMLVTSNIVGEPCWSPQILWVNHVGHFKNIVGEPNIFCWSPQKWWIPPICHSHFIASLQASKTSYPSPHASSNNSCMPWQCRRSLDKPLPLATPNLLWLKFRECKLFHMPLLPEGREDNFTRELRPWEEGGGGENHKCCNFVKNGIYETLSVFSSLAAVFKESLTRHISIGDMNNILYTVTSDKGPSEKRTTSLERIFNVPKFNSILLGFKLKNLLQTH